MEAHEQITELIVQDANAKHAGRSWWNFTKVAILLAIAVFTALPAAGTIFLLYALNGGADVSHQVDMLEQAGCLRYYQFVVDERRAGMSANDIQSLTDLAARSSSPDARFDRAPNGCGTVAQVLTTVQVAPK